MTDLASVLDRSVADLAATLNQACAAGVLAESGQHLRFRHPLIHAALYADLPAPVRAAWHREAARALAVAGVPATGSHGNCCRPRASPTARLNRWTNGC